MPKKEFSIYKTDDSKRLVFGWASVSITVDGVQVEDRQSDMIDPEVLEEAAYEYVLNFRDTGEEHISTMRKKGKLVESCVFTEEKQRAIGIPAGIIPVGWWIGFRIEDDAAWEKVKNGTYRMFSIEGRATREEIQKSDPVAKTFDEILKFNPYHDSRGRFSSANGAASMTYAPGKSKAHDNAIERDKSAYNTAAGLVSKAKENEPAMTQTLQECAASVGGEMVGLQYAVKSEESLTRKIKTEMKERGVSAEEAGASMKDVNRYTMQLTEENFVSGYNSTMEVLSSKGYEVVRVKNTLKNPDAEYRGVNTNIRNPDGTIWELQFHTKSSLEVKEINHKLYETQRLDSTSAADKVSLGKQMSNNAKSIPSPEGIGSIENVNNL